MSSVDLVLEALDNAVESLAAVDLDVLAPPERFVVLERLEVARRRQVAMSHAVVARLEQFEGCPPIPITLGDVLRISPREAKRRIRDAEELAPRRALTGEPLPPLLPETSKAWHDGKLDGEHLRVVQKFFRDLPDHVPPTDVENAERTLAEHAVDLRPDQLEKIAHQLSLLLNPDGRFSDEDRARKRGFVWCGGQQVDGMSVGRLIADPQLRCMLDAWFTKFAAPGVCNPADQTPTLTPSEQVAERDLRSHGQRQHDALTALVRGQLGDPKLGQHNGLPVTVIATATVHDLQAKAGHAVTATGTLLPIPDLIRMASHSYHYLALFDGVDGRALWLGRTKRVASADQRIMLHGKERGCTRPGCDAPGYLTEVHHVDEWAQGGLTNIDKLTLACPADHRLLDQGWKTRKLANGDTEWIPPPQLPLAAGTNTYHHPERLLGS
ncbi:HNH endonuclease signature motif containing protein [Mycobacterium sp. EPa45]|uniref:HNH endonuclease signature motif containing protein n=1 Tax=Mycobacterium sp. EPa45 TaxID=1545728 RepID=UPI0006427218|nr:HNH endonuclease signature motif containing protein [Mycobacterium sp. EPa45]AKK28053.1 maturase [Mycobacterium sp. EPa45]